MTALTLPMIKTKRQWVTPLPFLMSPWRNLFIWEVSMKRRSFSQPCCQTSITWHAQ